MSAPFPSAHYLFGQFELDSENSCLLTEEHVIHLQPQILHVLLLLLEHAGRILTREEIRQSLWTETFVEYEDGLNHAIRKLRQILGDSVQKPRFIETVPRRGYRFIARVEREPVSKPRLITVRRIDVFWKLPFALGVAAALVGVLLMGIFPKKG